MRWVAEKSLAPYEFTDDLYFHDQHPHKVPALERLFHDAAMAAGPGLAGGGGGGGAGGGGGGWGARGGGGGGWGACGGGGCGGGGQQPRR